jgi:hypothetical protein
MIATWLQSVGATTTTLFETDGLEPRVIIRRSIRKLKRHPEFDENIITTVDNGLANERWRGLIYLMHFGTGAQMEPLYIGKTERKGTKNLISGNIKNIRTNMNAFARWGYALDYHIGDLSHAIFEEEGLYRSPRPKYRRWVECLFETTDPLTLRDQVHVSLVSWVEGMRGPSGLVGSVPAVEKELIALCDSESLLNIDGR